MQEGGSKHSGKLIRYGRMVAALPTIFQYSSDDCQSTGYVMRFEVIPDSFEMYAVQVILFQWYFLLFVMT